MKPTHMQLAFAAAFWLTLGSTLASGGQNNAAQPPWRGHLALASRGHLGLAFLGHRGPIAFQMQGQDALATREQGRDALATEGVPQEPVIVDDGPLQPVTVEHRGRLLVLTYGPKSTGGLMVDPDRRREPPRFVISQSRRQIASGQFEYG